MKKSRTKRSFTCFGRSLRECPSRISRAAFFFLAILPMAGLLQAVGDGLQRAGLARAIVLSRAAESVFTFSPLILAVCLAWILTGENEITAAFSGGLTWVVLHQAASWTSKILLPAADVNFQENIFTGLVAGFLTGLFYKILYRNRLPGWLRFFSGHRLVPLLLLPAAIFVGGFLGYLWHLLDQVFNNLINWISISGPLGAFAYGTLSRWLMPFGLHNVLDQGIWYKLGNYTSLSGELISGEINRFIAGDPAAGRLLAGFFPMTMFGIPAISACLVLTARKGRRLAWGGCFVSAALLSLISGVTMPFDIILLFLSPPLFLIYGLLFGLSLFLTWHLDIYHGFVYGTGLADYLTYWHYADKPGILLIVGAVLAHVSFAITFISIRWLRFPATADDKVIPKDYVFCVETNVRADKEAVGKDGAEVGQ